MKTVICPDCGRTELTSTIIAQASGRLGVIGCPCGSPEEWRDAGEDYLPLTALTRDARMDLPIHETVTQSVLGTAQTADIRIPVADAQTLEAAALAAGIDDPRMRKTTTPRGSVAGICRALAAKEREQPGAIQQLLGK